MANGLSQWLDFSHRRLYTVEILSVAAPEHLVEPVNRPSLQEFRKNGRAESP